MQNQAWVQGAVRLTRVHLKPSVLGVRLACDVRPPLANNKGGKAVQHASREVSLLMIGLESGECSACRTLTTIVASRTTDDGISAMIGLIIDLSRDGGRPNGG